MRLARLWAAQGELRDATCVGWARDMIIIKKTIKQNRKTFFLDEKMFSKKYENRKFSKKKSFFEEKISLFFIDFSLKKVTFLKKIFRFFSSRKIFFVQLFVSKKSSNYFLKTNFWSRFFSNICAV